MSIQDALRTIKGNGRGAVFIVDEDYGLKGILTDGDIRAGILKNINLNVSVRVLMNTNPMVEREKKSPEAIHRLMMETSFNIIPRINEAGQIDRLILTLMDKATPVGDIAHQVSSQFPARFPTWQDALAQVGELAQRYSE